MSVSSANAIVLTRKIANTIQRNLTVPADERIIRIVNYRFDSKEIIQHRLSRGKSVFGCEDTVVDTKPIVYNESMIRSSADL